MISTFEKVCEVCGKWYLPTRSNQKYCPECGSHSGRKRKQMDRIIHKNQSKYNEIEYENRVVESQCKRCGKVIKAGHKIVYCSDACRDAQWAEDAVCPVCGESMLAKGITVKYGDTHSVCSDECYEKRRWEQARKNGRVVECKHCGKEFIADKYSGRSYCSRDCYMADIKLGNNVVQTQKLQDIPKRFITRTCAECGKPYSYELDDLDELMPRLYCSNECDSKARARQTLEKKMQKDLNFIERYGLCANCSVSYKSCIRMTSNFKYSPEGASFGNSGTIVRCPQYKGKLEKVMEYIKKQDELMRIEERAFGDLLD